MKKSILLILLNLFLISTLFLSCYNDSISSQVGDITNTDSKEEIETNFNNLKSDLFSLATQSIETSQDIYNLLSVNDKNILSTNLEVKLKLCKTENDIANLFLTSKI